MRSNVSVPDHEFVENGALAMASAVSEICVVSSIYTYMYGLLYMFKQICTHLRAYTATPIRVNTGVELILSAGMSRCRTTSSSRTALSLWLLSSQTGFKFETLRREVHYTNALILLAA